MQRATLFFILCALPVCLTQGYAEEAPVYLSPGTMVMSEDGGLLYIGAQTANKIIVFDVAAGAVAHEWPLDASPAGLALSRDGAQLIATLDGAPGRVQVLNPADGRVLQEILVGHTPMAPVITPDGKTLYVSNQFDSNVVRINLETGAIEATIPAGREPVAAAISADGAYLLVANQLPAGRADQAYTAATVSVIHTPTDAFVQALALPNGSSSLRDIGLSPDGQFAYVTHILSRYQLPTTQLERGWMNTNALTIIDMAKREILNTVLLDSVDLGASNPWAVACTADGAHLVVTQAGTHEISVIDRAALHDKLNRVAAGERVSSVSAKPEDVPNDLSFLVDVRRRIRLTGNGPRAVALSGTIAYVGEYFSDTLCVVDFSVESRPRPESIALAAAMPQTAERLGEQHFHDAALCFQQWQSCASCHPGARADALNWDLLNDGLGNPKNTKSMLYSHVTPPSMMTGIRDDAETAVRSGIKFIQFAVRPEEDAQAIDAYLKALRPLPSPWLVDGALSEKAQKGKEIFERAQCSGCHSGPYFTNMQQYDVGTGRGRDEGLAYDTPTLIEVWRTAPYLVDGRATTMMDVLTRFNRQDLHGATTTLTEDELAALAEYVLSL